MNPGAILVYDNFIDNTLIEKTYMKLKLIIGNQFGLTRDMQVNIG